MNKNTCLFCGEDIHEEANGNRQYCDDNCYYLEKLHRQKEKRNREYEFRENKTR
jgi:hypothetical protein